MNDHHQRLSVADLLAERAVTPTHRRDPGIRVPRRTIAPAPRQDSAEVIARIDTAIPGRVAMVATERLQAQLVRERLLAQRCPVPEQGRGERSEEPVDERGSAVQWIDPLLPARQAVATTAPKAEPVSRPETAVRATPAERAAGSVVSPLAGAVAGAGAWSGLHWLWAHQPALAFVTAMIVVAAMVSITRRFGHRCSVAATVLVGLIVTVSPAALVLLAH